jgi:cell division cycle 20-like protein 1 (cofactor of APC complex)
MKVLSAPELQDDFYLNIIDWSAQNVLSVGLGSDLYVLSASTFEATMLCELYGSGNAVTSVAWNERVSNSSIIIFMWGSKLCHC